MSQFKGRCSTQDSTVKLKFLNIWESNNAQPITMNRKKKEVAYNL